jgi:hypothetical protein
MGMYQEPELPKHARSLNVMGRIQERQPQLVRVGRPQLFRSSLSTLSIFVKALGFLVVVGMSVFRSE